MRQALRSHLGPEDVEQVGLFVQKKFSFPELMNFTSGHVSARQIRPAIGEAVYRDYFKFAFVRNPYDRFISYCSFMSRDSGAFLAQPKAFMKNIITQIKPVDHLLYKPQYEFLIDDDDKLAVNYVGRHETMQQSYNEICSRLRIPPATLEIVNSSQHRHYGEYYDDESRALVAEVYGRDIEMFAYR